MQYAGHTRRSKVHHIQEEVNAAAWENSPMLLTQFAVSNLGVERALLGPGPFSLQLPRPPSHCHLVRIKYAFFGTRPKTLAFRSGERSDVLSKYYLSLPVLSRKCLSFGSRSPTSSSGQLLEPSVKNRDHLHPVNQSSRQPSRNDQTCLRPGELATSLAGSPIVCDISRFTMLLTLS